MVTLGLDASDKVVTLAPMAGDIGGDMYEGTGWGLLLLLLF